MPASFTTAASLLSAGQSTISTQASALTAPAAAVAALATTAVGSETDAERVTRLEELFNRTYGAYESEVARLLTKIQESRAELKAELFAQRGPAGSA
jgi:hypothetical protein